MGSHVSSLFSSWPSFGVQERHGNHSPSQSFAGPASRWALKQIQGHKPGLGTCPWMLSTFLTLWLDVARHRCRNSPGLSGSPEVLLVPPVPKMTSWKPPESGPRHWTPWSSRRWHHFEGNALGISPAASERSQDAALSHAVISTARVQTTLKKLVKLELTWNMVEIWLKRA